MSITRGGPVDSSPPSPALAGVGRGQTNASGLVPRSLSGGRDPGIDK
eukprot:CAMPEP_0118985908 /NCGR_PEP_ID=MMETSP1173-20130426/41000_1 /TAXON_ID=1034831 /ORGANISM="Rhizochromulina marina cf, Strain CCMP1243" /LENGTH=46 /DNA_ID= /DNA_START= /DNA_END= /DNA_ORIENTATION=